MIEMPASRANAGAAPIAAGQEPAPDAPEGAFAEMLSRNLGRGLVRHSALYGEEPQQDAANGQPQSDAELQQGTALAAVPSLPMARPPQLSAAATTPGVGAEPLPAASGPSSGPAVAPQPSAAAAASATTTAAATFTLGWQSDEVPMTPAVPAAEAPQATSKPSSEPRVWDSPWLETTAQAASSAPLPAAAQSVLDASPPGPGAAPPPATTAPMAPGVAPMNDSATAPASPDPAGASTGQAQRPTDTAAAAAVMSRLERPASTRPGLRSEPAAEPGSAQGGPVPTATSTAPEASSPPETSPVPNSRLINRVIRMVEYQQTQPPPRMVIVDMPELSGLRLMVAVQADGKVHVAPIAGSAPPQVAEPFLQAVGAALSAEGFNLAEGSENRDRRERPERPEPEAAPRRVERRRRRSAGLRL